MVGGKLCQLGWYEDANEFTACLDECAHSGRAASANLGGRSVLPAFLPLQHLLFPLVSASAQLLTGHRDVVTLSERTRASTGSLQGGAYTQFYMFSLRLSFDQTIMATFYVHLSGWMCQIGTPIRAQIQQGAGNILQRFCAVLTWSSHSCRFVSYTSKMCVCHSTTEIQWPWRLFDNTVMFKKLVNL